MSKPIIQNYQIIPNLPLVDMPIDGSLAPYKNTIVSVDLDKRFNIIQDVCSDHTKDCERNIIRLTLEEAKQIAEIIYGNSS
jgi:hypothetical protein